ncbi:hypothetical protein ABPG72_003899 [Tetrahymena utriculariae]
MKAFVLLAIIALTAVHCEEPATWPKAQQKEAYDKCLTDLTAPTCSTSDCSAAFNTFNTCAKCNAKFDTYTNLKACVKQCTDTFILDEKAKADTTAATYITNYKACDQKLNTHQSLLALSALLLAAFALLF